MKDTKILRTGLNLAVLLLIILMSLPLCLSQGDINYDIPDDLPEDIPEDLPEDIEPNMTKEGFREQLKENPYLKEGIMDEFEQTITVLEKEFENISKEEDPDTVAVFIRGSDVNAVEDAFLYYSQDKFDFITKMDHLTDKDFTYQRVMNEERIIILLGGPSQNSITKRLVIEGVLHEKEHESDDKLVIHEGVNREGSKIIVISDQRGFENFGRLGAERSPLAKYMPKNAVLATASIISIFLAFLWANIGGAIRVWLAKVVTGRKKKKLEKATEARGFNIGGIRIKFREVIAILIGCLAYTTGVALAIAGLGYPFGIVLRLSIIGGLLFFGVRELGRIILCYFKGLHTEYVLWIPGAIFAVATGWLGNTLNTPGFVIEHKDKEIKFRKYAFVKYIIVLATFLLSVGLFIYNIINPSKGIQVFAVIASTYATAEMMPFKPMPGKDIWDWRPILFVLTFCLIFVSYVVFNFVV
ncbi:hypothetical protein ACFL96_17295 [Thermoproteota archaeon]